MARAVTLNEALDGIERLQRSYRLERMIFVIGALAAMLLMIVISIVMLVSGQTSLAVFLPLLGSGGLFMGTGFGAMFYFGKSFDLLREMARGDGQ